MIKVSEKKKILAEKTFDLANLITVGLVFNQFSSNGNINSNNVLMGMICFLALYSYSWRVILKKDESND